MSTYLEREREKLAALDAELRDLDTSRSDRAFIERLAAPGSFTAEPPRTSAELNAQRTKDWEVWLRARLDAERLALFDAIAESMGASASLKASSSAASMARSSTRCRFGRSASASECPPSGCSDRWVDTCPSSLNRPFDWHRVAARWRRVL
jgi:hypothetical protein